VSLSIWTAFTTIQAEGPSDDEMTAGRIIPKVDAPAIKEEAIEVLYVVKLLITHLESFAE